MAADTVGEAAAGEAAADEVSQLIQAGAKWVLPRVLELLQGLIRKHAQPVLKKLAFGVSEKTDVGSRRYRSSSAVDVADVTALFNAPSAVYCKALHALLDRVEKCLDDPSRVAQQWLLQQCGKLLGASSGGLANIDARTTALQKALQSKLSEEHKKMLFDDSKQSLAAQLNAHVRSMTAKRALAETSQFSSKGCLAMLALVVSTDPLVLSKHEKELNYLLEKLGKLGDADVTEQQWRDYYESWASFLALRPRLEAECAQHIFDAIVTDGSVFTGLGVAHLLKDSVIRSGQVPNELLLQLQQGARHDGSPTAQPPLVSCPPNVAPSARDHTVAQAPGSTSRTTPTPTGARSTQSSPRLDASAPCSSALSRSPARASSQCLWAQVTCLANCTTTCSRPMRA